MGQQAGLIRIQGDVVDLTPILPRPKAFPCSVVDRNAHGPEGEPWILVCLYDEDGRPCQLHGARRDRDQVTVAP